MTKEHMIHIFARGTKIPTPGEKTIEESIGNVSSQTDQFSIAHMKMPKGWSEPTHSTQFDELVIVVSGALTLTSCGREFVVRAGQVCRVEPISDIAFSNSGTIPCEYWAICIPAFHPDRVRSQDG